ncbi:MAG TPA: hypothetical protein QGG47_08180 [Acidobacteriota bacterium]|nr:hypothetical protein [Acidobacteriota bacterium]
MVDNAERLEAALRAIPAHSGLEGEAEEQFRLRRQRIGRRQSDWRRNMGSLSPLFDDDAHCAKALAGNLATELTEILRAWAQVRSSADRPFRSNELQPLLPWIDEVAEQWRSVARGYVALEGWESEAVEVFDGFLDELSERAVAGAVEELRTGSPSRTVGTGRWGAAAKWVQVLIGAAGRVFHPRPPGSR